MLEPQCPFFVNIFGHNVSCEVGRFKFPDLTAKNALVHGFCAGDYTKCVFYKILQDYYRRKYGD